MQITCWKRKYPCLNWPSQKNRNERFFILIKAIHNFHSAKTQQNSASNEIRFYFNVFDYYMFAPKELSYPVVKHLVTKGVKTKEEKEVSLSFECLLPGTDGLSA